MVIPLDGKAAPDGGARTMPAAGLGVFPAP
jgi:hypothetical protein